MKKFDKKLLKHDVVSCFPLPTNEELQVYYKEKYYQNNHGSYSENYTPEEIQYKSYECDLLIKSLIENSTIDHESLGGNNLLELGSGEGYLLARARKSGLQVTGVDHSSFGVKKCNPSVSKYLVEDDIYTFIEQEENFGKFDYCVMKNILEHLLDPGAIIQKVKRVLKPGGLVAITVPNDFSKLQRRLLESDMVTEAEWFAPPDHLYYFNTENIKPFFTDLGVEPVDMYTSFPVDMFLFNSFSNYAEDPKKGKAAHHARVALELLISEAGLDHALTLYRSFAACNIGRNVTVVLKCTQE